MVHAQGPACISGVGLAVERPFLDHGTAGQGTKAGLTGGAGLDDDGAAEGDAILRRRVGLAGWRCCRRDDSGGCGGSGRAGTAGEQARQDNYCGKAGHGGPLRSPAAVTVDLGRGSGFGQQRVEGAAAGGDAPAGGPVGGRARASRSAGTGAGGRTEVKVSVADND